MRTQRWFPSCALLVVVLVTWAATAAGFTLRAPQVPFQSSGLTTYLTSKGESAINVTTAQVDAQVWAVAVSNVASFTLMAQLTATPGGNAIGLYNVSEGTPSLFQIFPGTAVAGWYAVICFSNGGATVSRFDQNSAFQGQSTYTNVHPNGFGFYLQGAGGTFFSQDARNGNKAQILTFAGTGVNTGDWWEVFEDQPYVAGTSNFTDEVLMLQSVEPMGREQTTWGSVKALYQ